MSINNPKVNENILWEDLELTTVGKSDEAVKLIHFDVLVFPNNSLSLLGIIIFYVCEIEAHTQINIDRFY